MACVLSTPVISNQYSDALQYSCKQYEGFFEPIFHYKESGMSRQDAMDAMTADIEGRTRRQLHAQVAAIIYDNPARGRQILDSGYYLERCLEIGEY